MAEGIDLKMKVSGANKVQRELKQTGKAARGMGAGVSKAGAAMGSMAAAINPVAAGLAIAAAGFVAVAVAAKVTKDVFVGTIKATIKLADELDTITKKAQSIGATNTDIQLVSNAMALFGVETSQTIKATQKFNQALGQAMLPDAPKTLLAAFDRLGMSARELAEMPLRERFIKISEAFAAYENQAMRAADASLLFGRMGKDALTAFSQGGEAMAAAMKDVERYGIASDEAFKNSENLVDAQLRLKLAIDGLKTEALTPLMPALEGAAQGMADYLASLDAQAVKDFASEVRDALAQAVMAFSAFGLSAEQAWIVAMPLMDAFQAALVGSTGNLKGAALNAAEALKGAFDVPEEFDKAEARWNKVGDNLANAMMKALTVAPGPMLGPEFLAPMQGAGLPPGYVAPPPGAPRGRRTGSTKAGKVTDPLAGLKRELDAITKQLKTKEQLIAESLVRQLQATHEAVDAELITKEQGLAQDAALIAANDARLLGMAEAQAAKMLQISKAEADEQKRINDEAVAAAAARQAGEAAAAVATLNAVGTFASEISTLITTLSDEQNEEAKEAAKVLFGIQQSAALAAAIVSTAQAVTVAIASAPAPLNVPAIIAASVGGAAQIATIASTTIQGLAHAGLPPGALAGSGSNEATIMMRRDEMILDPIGTKAISQMLSQRSGGGQPVQVNTTLEIDGDVLGRTVDTHLVRSSERGLSYQDKIRY